MSIMNRSSINNKLILYPELHTSHLLKFCISFSPRYISISCLCVSLETDTVKQKHSKMKYQSANSARSMNPESKTQNMGCDIPSKLEL